MKFLIPLLALRSVGVASASTPLHCTLSNPTWEMGSYSRAAASEISITKDQTGYVVMNCR